MGNNKTERFFIVKETSPLFKQHLAYQEFIHKSAEVFSAFAKDVGINAATNFRPDPDLLGIIPIGKDAETFSPYFTEEFARKPIA